MTSKTMRAGLVILATMVMAFAIALVLLNTRWGEERARLSVESAITDAMPGRFTMQRLGDFDVLSPPGIFGFTAEGLRAVDGEGQELFEVSELSAELDLVALLGRELRVPWASVSGAQIPCDLETGRPKISTPPARRDLFEPRAMGIRLENVDIVGLYLVATKPDGERAILGRLTGGIDVTVPRAEPGVKMNVRGVKGVMSHPMAVRLHDATGEIDTSANTAADIRFSADASGAAVTGRLRYEPRDRAEPLKFSFDKVRALDDSMFGGNPLDALGGMGFPADMLRGIDPKKMGGEWTR